MHHTLHSEFKALPRPCSRRSHDFASIKSDSLPPRQGIPPLLRPAAGNIDFPKDRRDQPLPGPDHSAGGTKCQPCPRGFQLWLRPRNRQSHPRRPQRRAQSQPGSAGRLSGNLSVSATRCRTCPDCPQSGFKATSYPASDAVSLPRSRGSMLRRCPAARLGTAGTLSFSSSGEPLTGCGKQRTSVRYRTFVLMNAFSHFLFPRRWGVTFTGKD